MKKWMIAVVALCLCSSSAFAQKGEISVGVAGNYNFHTENFGAGVKFKWNVTEGLRLSPGFNYNFKKDHLETWDANIDLNYLIPLTHSGKFKIYPIVGATMVHWKYDATVNGKKIKADDDEFGANLGAGLQFDIAKRWYVNADYTYKWVNHKGGNGVLVGVGFKF